MPSGGLGTPCLEERLQVTIHRLKFNAQYPIDMEFQRYEPLFNFCAVRCLTLDQHLSFLHIQQNPSLLNLSGCVNLPDKFGGALACHTRQRVLRKKTRQSTSHSAELLSAAVATHGVLANIH
jgi:hypothetical protein